MNDTFEIGGVVYIFDIDAILSYINYSNGKEITEKEIIDDYDLQDKSKIKNKTIKQVITPMDTSMDNIRYDLVKMFIITIMNTDFSVYEEMTFGVKMAFDSLVSLGLIKEYKV